MIKRAANYEQSTTRGDYERELFEVAKEAPESRIGASSRNLSGQVSQPNRLVDLSRMGPTDRSGSL